MEPHWAISSTFHCVLEIFCNNSLKENEKGWSLKMYTEGEQKASFSSFPRFLWRLSYFLSVFNFWKLKKFLATVCGMWELSSLTRDWTRAPVLEAISLNHWTTRQVVEAVLYSNHVAPCCTCVNLGRSPNLSEALF